MFSVANFQFFKFSAEYIIINNALLLCKLKFNLITKPHILFNDRMKENAEFKPRQEIQFLQGFSRTNTQSLKKLKAN